MTTLPDNQIPAAVESAASADELENNAEQGQFLEEDPLLDSSSDHHSPSSNEDQPRLSRRSIRSFVIRAGRTTGAQQRALESLWPRFGLPYTEAPLDLAQVFGRSCAAAPKILEIGFGMGETSARISAENPQNDYLGIEVHTPGVGALLLKIEELGLSNQRIIQHDAHEVLENMIPPGSLGGIHIFFPDPWHKKRHHKRRLVQAPLVALLASRLAPGGYLHCATDWEEYAEQMMLVLSADPALENTAGGYAPRPDYRPLTKFEHRGLRLGHGVWDLVFRRR